MSAFLYNGTSLVNLGTLGGTDSEATGINTSGEVVGYSETTKGSTTNEAFTYIDSMAGLAPVSKLQRQLRRRGQRLGRGRGQFDRFLRASARPLRRSPPCGTTDAATSLGTLNGYDASYATAINDSGEVVGYVYNPGIQSPPDHAFLYDPGCNPPTGRPELPARATAPAGCSRPRRPSMIRASSWESEPTTGFKAPISCTRPISL